jgi:predicted enzyme related to lactoylglutathione lyase
MKTASALGMALWMVAGSLGCGSASAPETTPVPPVSGSGTQTTGVMAKPTAPTASPGTTAAPVASAAAGAGTPATNAAAASGSHVSAATGGTTVAAGSGGSAPATVTAGTAAGGGSGGVLAAAGGTGAAAGGTTPPQDIPAPMKAPLVWGFALGITDVPAATKFYSEVMQLGVEKDSVKRTDSTETFLYSTKAMRGARLVLMKFDDMRNTRKITTKLVWQAQDTAGVNTAAAKYPDYVSRLNFGIVQFDGPETYIQEVGGSFDTGGGAISVPYPVAMGFAVSDQPASRKFYTSLGMTESSLGTFSVTDATGTGSIMEWTVKFTDGMGLVLQQWTPERNAKNNPVKAILFVPDAKAMADKVTAAGGTIVTPAERSPVYDNRLLVIAKDLDGYVLDIVE